MFVMMIMSITESYLAIPVFLRHYRIGHTNPGDMCMGRVHTDKKLKRIYSNMTINEQSM